MKKITGLDEPVSVVIARPQDEKAPKLILREVLLVELSLSKKAKDKMRLYKIGVDLMNAKKDIELEDADFQILKDVLETPAHPDFIIGGILQKMEDSNKKP